MSKTASQTSKLLKHKTERKVRRFTKEEDHTIIEEVKKRGITNGLRISSEKLGRSSRSVEERYHNFICRRTFSQEEVQLIVNLHDQGLSFKNIRYRFPGSTPVMLRIEYKRFKRLSKNYPKKSNNSISMPSVSEKNITLEGSESLEEESIFNDFNEADDLIYSNNYYHELDTLDPYADVNFEESLSIDEALTL